MGIIAERWVADERVQIVVQRATGLSRLTGLLKSGPPRPGQALLIPRCRSVHAVGMREGLDVVFLRGERALTVRRLRPGRIVICAAADSALELRAGEAERLAITPGVRFDRRNDQRGEAGLAARAET